MFSAVRHRPLLQAGGIRLTRQDIRREQGVALIAVMGLIVLITGVAMSALQITGISRLAAAADQRVVAQSTCADRATRFLQDQLGDWKLILARVGSSARCSTLYTMNMEDIPEGDVLPPPTEQNYESCFTNGEAAKCPAGAPCDGNAAWEEYMNRQALEQARFRDKNTIEFAQCPETRAVVAMADPVMIGQNVEVGEEAGKTVGNAGSCYYNVRLFAMHLPQNDMRFYSNYLDKEIVRQIFSSTGCLQ